MAAFYYALNLRETTRNRRMALTTNLMQSLFSEEGNRRFLNLLMMEWKDQDDFMKKYDSRVNGQNFIDRMTYWEACEILGYQYRAGLIDKQTLYGIGRGQITAVWAKFKPVIEEYRKADFLPDMFENFEFLANDLWKIAEGKGATGRRYETHGVRADEYEGAFSGEGAKQGL
jgi:hypothetical protein